MGIPSLPNPMAVMAAVMAGPANIMATVQRVMNTVQNVTFYGGGEASKAAIAGTREAADNVRAGVERAASASEFVADEGQDIVDAADDPVVQTAATTLEMGQEEKGQAMGFMHRMGNFITEEATKLGQSWMTWTGLVYILLFFGVIFSFFGYVKKICEWFVNTSACVIEKITNFKTCFFWYLLDIIFEIMYLPIRVILWLASPEMFDVCEVKQVHDMVVRQRDKLDCFIYENYGFHIFRYPHSEQKRCYKCKFKKFPNIAAHFEGIETSSAEDFFKSLFAF